MVGLAVALSMVVSPPSAASGSAPTAIRITPTVGPPTSRAVVTGRGFGGSETVDLAFDSAPVGRAMTDPNGAFSQPVRIPASALPGDHVVSATGESSGRSAQATFTVRTDWPKAHFDLANTGHNPYENVLSPSTVGDLALRWSVPTPSRVQGSVSVVGGVAYAGLANPPGQSDAYVMAVDVATGTVLWRYHDPDGSSPSALAVAYGRVYVSMLGCHCLRTLSAKTGRLLWTFSGPSDTPAVADGVVYVGSNLGYFYAIDARTGQQVWRIFLGDGVFDASAVVGGVLYAGSQTHNLYAIDRATGAIVWTFPTGDEILGSPSVAHGLVYVGSFDHHVYAVDAATGQPRWTQTTGAAVESSPAVADGLVFVGSNDFDLYAFDAKSGVLRWTAPTSSYITIQSAAVAGGVVYQGSNDGAIYAFDASDGTQLWSYQTGNAIGTHSTVADGVLYVGSDDDHLYAFSLPG